MREAAPAKNWGPGDHPSKTWGGENTSAALTRILHSWATSCPATMRITAPGASASGEEIPTTGSVAA
jgi:hypothetical protein